MDKVIIRLLLISPAMTIKESMQRLIETGEKILFIVEDGKRLLGTVTDGDIRRGITKGTPLNAPVSDVMATEFISVSADTPEFQKKARQLMHQHVIDHIPVMDEAGEIADVLSWINYLDEDNERSPVERRENTVVIMAGGKGARLDPFTRILPKPLIPLGEKPIVEHVMDRFHKNGFQNFTLVINYKKEMIKMYFNETKRPYSINYREEEDYYGTAGGLSILRDELKETFLLTNCDTLLDGEYNDFFNWHRQNKNLLTIVGSHKEVSLPYGVLNMNNGSLANIDEKPSFDLFVNTGTYIVEPEVLALVKDKEHIDMDRLIGRVQQAQPEGVGVYPFWGGWFDIGQWDEYKKSMKQMQIGDG